VKKKKNNRAYGTCALFALIAHTRGIRRRICIIMWRMARMALARRKPAKAAIMKKRKMKEKRINKKESWAK